MKRHKVSYRKSRRQFKRTALKTHKKNLASPSRGGIRM